eukprot:108987_1
MTMHRPTTKVDDSNGKSDFKLIDEHNEPIPDTLLKKTTATVTIAEDVEGKFGDNDAQFDDARSYYDRQLNADMSDFNAIDIDAIEFDGRRDAEPFYSGMDVVMGLPEFCIRLCWSTPVSVRKEIAMNFSKSGGMIIELNNNG